MKSKVMWVMLSFLVVLSLVLASCAAEKTTTTPTTTPPITTTTPTPTAAHWWDKLGEPKYGGQLVLYVNADIASFDPYVGQINGCAYLDQMGGFDRTIDPSVCAYNTGYYPSNAYTGGVAESWETTDFATFTFHIRKGIHWWNKPPVNGRELTAEDVVYSYHRIMGNGDGFTVPSRYWLNTGWIQLESITAPERYTVVFKFKVASVQNLLTILEQTSCNHISGPKEAVSTWGQPGAKDWTQVIGTGAFMIKDYVQGNSYTLVKNPNYWGYDDRWPKNKLPYLDYLKVAIIVDSQTALAALRSGRIDRMGGTVENITWQQSEALKKTNPEILQLPVPQPANGLHLRVDKSPFTDIKVRTAMQMAMDLPTIAKSYYNGVDWKPWGPAGTEVHDANNPYDTWPKALQDEYTYNVPEAKKLLADAGFPNGFTTTCLVSSSQDTQLLQVMQSYLKDIGITMNIDVRDAVTQQALTRARKYDVLFFPMGMAENKPMIRIAGNLTTGYPNNFPNLSDPVYDKMYADWLKSTSWEAANAQAKAIDMYVIKGHYRVALMPFYTYVAYQPWVGGYNGEAGQQEQYHYKYWWRKY